MDDDAVSKKHIRYACCLAQLQKTRYAQLDAEWDGKDRGRIEHRVLDFLDSEIELIENELAILGVTLSDHLYPTDEPQAAKTATVEPFTTRFRGFIQKLARFLIPD